MCECSFHACVGVVGVTVGVVCSLYPLSQFLQSGGQWWNVNIMYPPGEEIRSCKVMELMWSSSRLHLPIHFCGTFCQGHPNCNMEMWRCSSLSDWHVIRTLFYQNWYD